MDGLAHRLGTPLYVYSAGTILDHYRRLRGVLRAVDPLICYSVKANSNLAILSLLARAGSGFDVVSGGELERVRKAGGKPTRCVFAGVGKTDEEIELGLRFRVKAFHVESEEELERFLDLLLQHLTSIAAVMLRWHDEFAAHFNQIEIAVGADEGNLLSAEEWCFGYLRGVTAAGGWSDLPAYAQEALDCIRLHGTEERFDEWEALTPEQQQDSIRKIEPAVRQLYEAWRR